MLYYTITDFEKPAVRSKPITGDNCTKYSLINDYCIAQIIVPQSAT